jgi:hypothetical protein
LTADEERGRKTAEPTRRAQGVTQWILLFAPLVAAFVQQQVLYESVGSACRRGTLLAVHVATLLSGVVAIAASFVAWRAFARVGVRLPDDERSSDARARFMAVLALTAGGFALLLILAQWLPALFIDPCQR